MTCGGLRYSRDYRKQTIHVRPSVPLTISSVSHSFPFFVLLRGFLLMVSEGADV